MVYILLGAGVLVGGYYLYQNFTQQTQATALTAVKANAFQIGAGIGMGAVAGLLNTQSADGG